MLFSFQSSQSFIRCYDFSSLVKKCSSCELPSDKMSRMLFPDFCIACETLFCILLPENMPCSVASLVCIHCFVVTTGSSGPLIISYLDGFLEIIL